MLYHILYPLNAEISFFNIFRYITVRSFFAFALALLFSILLGKKFINFMQKHQFGQIVRDDGPQSHYKKRGTPTLGGILIFSALTFSLVLCGNWQAWPFSASCLIMFCFFVLGITDDLLKLRRKNSDGLSAKTKLFWQFLIAMATMFVLIRVGATDTMLYVPFHKGPLVDLGWPYLLFASIVIVGSSNAVNLTDGLDGLAIGPIISSAASLGIIAYLTGHFELAKYLYIPHFTNVGELVVLAAAVIGAGLGFLWYNSFPAEIFMGDVGSLSLGGFLGLMAVLTKSEILFIMIGGIFVIEALSVIIQVGSYKMRGKRIFKMAPIHHHFELKGWPEPKVIVRFWIISILLAIFAIGTLKIR
ncbi:MAG: phospho-N-acetylmuramoyl-pentapeptide-transferase [Bacteriovoracales bacterium]|nr:phospho-N-acetylmuramoyl-pentapeptide-transferase [Bacteriovoracales bacterium]